MAHVRDGMTLGIGTGSTAAYFIEALGKFVASGAEIKGIPTSEQSASMCRELNIPLIEPDETTVIDVAIDGADEVDPDGALIKGGGGALLREKIIAQAAQKFVVIADKSKDVSMLGAFPLPIEIDKFGWALSVAAIRRTFENLDYGAPKLSLRPLAEGGFFISDGGNYVVDVEVGTINDAAELDMALTMIPGVVTTGLFVGISDIVIFGTDAGTEVRDV